MPDPAIVRLHEQAAGAGPTVTVDRSDLEVLCQRYTALDLAIVAARHHLGHAVTPPA